MPSGNHEVVARHGGAGFPSPLPAGRQPRGVSEGIPFARSFKVKVPPLAGGFNFIAVGLMWEWNSKGRGGSERVMLLLFHGFPWRKQ